MNNLVSSTLRRIEIAERALSDLKEIWVHFSETSERTADKVLRACLEIHLVEINFTFYIRHF